MADITESINSEKAFNDIYKAAKNDRERAVETFDNMKDMIRAMSEKGERITPGVFEALNGAQQLIQSSTDKLVNLANLLNKKESIEKATDMNLQFDVGLLKDKDSEETINSTKKIGGKKR